MFNDKLIELTESISDDLRHEKLKDLQTWYVSTYMRIMLKIRSAENYLLHEGYMHVDFVSNFYYEIISRFADLTMTDINF